MHSLLKTIFSVIVAVAIGLTVVFFAWRAETLQKNNAPFEQTISGDSWKDSLLVVPVASSSKVLRETRKNSAVATTTTDLIARELLVNYAVLQQSTGTTTLSDADAQALAQVVVQKIVLPKGVQYSTKNLTISSDNTDSAFSTYAKNVGETIQTFSSSQRINELAVVAEALSTKDSATLQKLSSSINDYRALEKKLLAISAPSAVAPLHLRLVQNYANIEASIVGMKNIVSDPVVGLASLDQYNKEMTALDSLAVEYRNYSPAR
ncbi:hypothetical protein AUJ77_03415 [Candidatus Nomurabacteria bacterium CG1_02_43_90]|uniref:Uncharacterized protein n=1 Tax=Candidatus Nomurabacteria bacterium CG1_02_43_90 TaxID=1805281 RepID=A0A1J4V2X2_9BACT|nr:MAG: hypothetical protein AUJ77_03415 [Candidatus Nomurabacteria bacterium CG1_02_43_90]